MASLRTFDCLACFLSAAMEKAVADTENKLPLLKAFGILCQQQLIKKGFARIETWGREAAYEFQTRLTDQQQHALLVEASKVHLGWKKQMQTHCLVCLPSSFLRSADTKMVHYRG